MLRFKNQEQEYETYNAFDISSLNLSPKSVVS
jgi:hypothetical protein